MVITATGKKRSVKKRKIVRKKEREGEREKEREREREREREPNRNVTKSGLISFFIKSFFVLVFILEIKQKVQFENFWNFVQAKKWNFWSRRKEKTEKPLTKNSWNGHISINRRHLDFEIY